MRWAQDSKADLAAQRLHKIGGEVKLRRRRLHGSQQLRVALPVRRVELEWMPGGKVAVEPPFVPQVALALLAKSGPDG